ncbi:MAG: hypothetical protein ABL982_19370, partial [Vicinamibacterales bacterium]
GHDVAAHLQVRDKADLKVGSYDIRASVGYDMLSGPPRLSRLSRLSWPSRPTRPSRPFIH